MIFTDSVEQQVFRKPRLGSQNLLFDRSGDITGFGRFAAGALTGLGAVMGGSKGANIGASAFGALSSMAKSNTASSDIQANLDYNVERTTAKAMIPASIYGTINDIGLEIGKAVLTGGATAPGSIGKITNSVQNTSSNIQGAKSVLNTSPSQFRGIGVIPGVKPMDFSPTGSIDYLKRANMGASSLLQL